MPTVLVVDDSLSVRKALEKILTPRLTVHSAASAEAALEHLQSTPADLVIADVLMPGMSGFELCQHLRGESARRDVPVLLISGIVDDDVRARSDEVGARAVVRKPFTPDDLLPLVDAALASAWSVVEEPSTPARHVAPLADPRPLLSELAEKPGVVWAGLFDAHGELLSQQGRLSSASAMGRYVRFYLGTAATLGQRLECGEAQALQLDFEGRTLLIAPLDHHHALACLLEDAGGVGLVKYLLRSTKSLHA